MRASQKLSPLELPLPNIRFCLLSLPISFPLSINLSFPPVIGVDSQTTSEETKTPQKMREIKKKRKKLEAALQKRIFRDTSLLAMYARRNASRTPAPFLFLDGKGGKRSKGGERGRRPRNWSYARPADSPRRDHDVPRDDVARVVSVFSLLFSSSLA